MPVPSTYSFTRYLTAKKSVDDRALNQHVWQSLAAALPRATPEKPLQILEVGAGLGTMVERLFAGGMLTHATYTAIDLEPTLVAEARRRLSHWAAAQGLQVQQGSQEQLHVQRHRNRMEIRWRKPGARWHAADLAIACEVSRRQFDSTYFELDRRHDRAFGRQGGAQGQRGAAHLPVT